VEEAKGAAQFTTEHRFSRGRMKPPNWVVRLDSPSGNSLISGTSGHGDTVVFI
jgi:hypothetical protein